jgi:3-oxoacyl-[acyl-carrier-protein] synthase II
MTAAALDGLQDGVAPRRVAITGMGAVTPVGNGFEVLLDDWLAGRSRVHDAVARCSDFDPSDVMTTKEVRRSDRMTQFSLAAGLQATKQAGWDEGLPVPASRIGCAVGTAFGGIETIERQLARFRDRGPTTMSPLAIPNAMYNAPPALLSRRIGLHGPSCSVASACASGADAIGMGVRWIRTGVADAVVAGGADASATPFVVSLFQVVGTLSAGGVPRPFDAERDGFAMGEGAAMVTLEAMDAALARGAHVVGEVLGYASSSDSFHPTSPDPSGLVAAEAIRGALADARLTPDSVVYINAHGTGTRLNDHAETLAIKAALGADAHRVPISSIKSITGHLMGGAGAVEAGVSILAMARGVVPPTVNHVTADPELDLDYVGRAAGAARVDRRVVADVDRVLLSNSFGFGGHNTVLCLAPGSTRPRQETT